MATKYRIVHLVLGPTEHGVTRHALQLAQAAGEQILQLPTPSPPDADDVLRQVRAAGPDGVVHLHLTDHLLGTTPAAAALLVERLAGIRRVTVTLHDLPQPSDGPERHPRRSAAYARIVRAAVAVQVSSRYERGLLHRTISGVDPAVVPLPVPTRLTPAEWHRARAVEAATPHRPSVGVLGYLYPGKGHEGVLQALHQLGRPGVGMVAVGGPSAGHEWLVEHLTRLAGPRPMEITGYLDEAALDRALLQVDVPVMAPAHVSASGSVLRWMSCGRRPVAVRTAYTAELDQLLPGTLRLTDDLPTAIAHALDNPADTWLTEPAGWDVAAAAAAQTEAIHAAVAADAAPRAGVARR